MDKIRTRYYKSFEDDFFQVGKTYNLGKDYEYIKTGIGARFFSSLTYAVALAVSTVYCRLFLHVSFKGSKKLRSQKGGFFVYGNHTQPVGDVFNPALACFPKRIYTVVSVANLHLPVIGKLLPALGALPVPDTLSGMKNFKQAIEKRISDGHPVVIFPEAHLWEYYTGIRPFPDSSFSYPVSLDAPAFCLTTTYQKRRFGTKPKITVYADGPFYTDESIENRRERTKDLHGRIYAQMRERAKESNYIYIDYVRE